MLIVELSFFDGGIEDIGMGRIRFSYKVDLEERMFSFE
jgi:hypothetical protein